MYQRTRRHIAVDATQRQIYKTRRVRRAHGRDQTGTHMCMSSDFQND